MKVDLNVGYPLKYEVNETSPIKRFITKYFGYKFPTKYKYCFGICVNDSTPLCSGDIVISESGHKLIATRTGDFWFSLETLEPTSTIPKFSTVSEVIRIDIK